MGYFRAENPVLHFEDVNGRPLVGGMLYIYKAGTNTPETTYRDAEGEFANENPIVLNERGECVCFMDSEKSYKMVLKDNFDTVIWEADNIKTQPGGVVFTGNVFSMKVFTEGDHEPDAEYDPLDDEKSNLIQRSLRININGDTAAIYKPFNTENKEVNIHSESVEWDAGSHSIKKDVNGAKETIVEVENTYSPTSEKPISGKGVKDGEFVSVKSQSWSDAQKEQARSNINAVGGGDFLPRDSNIFQRVSRILWNGWSRSLIVEGHVGAFESGALPPLAKGDGSDEGKIPFVELFSGSYYNLVYRFILENCATNSDVLQSLQRGQIPCFKSLSGTYIPYFVDSNGTMYVNNVFGVSDKNPMTGDALGKSLRRTIYNGNVNNECLWGKPYGINYFEIGKYKCNNDYHLGLSNENRMVWRRVPIDRQLTITGIGIVGNGDTINKTLMNGIFEYDGDTLTKVSDATTWSVTQGYINSQENIVSLDYMIDNNSGDFDFALFSFTSPVVLKEGYNYLIPSRYNNSHTYNDPYICTYKKASPAMPWEDLVSANTENGDPVMSTARAGCKPSALMLTLSDGTAMWI